MNWQAWLTLLVVAVTVYALARDLLAPAVAVLGAVIALLVAGVITPDEAFSGLSNPAPITVAALYVLARAVEKTGALQPVLNATLGDRRGMRASLARLLVPSAAASAFLNNTPIVAMLVPQVTEWAQRRGRSPSIYLMPLSFAVILGGVITLIGTSTNLVVSGLLQAAGQPPIGMFELTRIGLPVALVGVAALVALAPLVLKERRAAREDLSEDVREFVVGMDVVPGGPLDGQAVEAGGLRHLQGVFLVQLERAGQLIAPVAPTTVLQGGDRLTFVGKASLVVDLQRTRGLVSSEQKHVARFDTTRHTFVAAVVGAASALVGKTLKEVGFRARYQAAVVAVHRSGQRVDAKLGEVRLKLGDTLLLLTDPGFRDRWRDRSDFLLIAPLGGTPPAASRKAWIVGLVALAIVVGAGSGLLPVLQLSLLGAVALVLLGVLTPGEARGALDLDVLLVIAGAFGLAAAMERSGLAATIADGLTNGFSFLGPVGVLLGVTLATVALTELVTNNAAAALMFPIALRAAADAGAAARPFAIAITIAASCSFLTPIGYQTNTMVYGPGGYRFGDYARLGLPLTILVVTTVVLVVPVFWKL
jgi:di/tricarboxylate transporter